MPRNLDIGLLRTLIQVADSGSMTAAASRLHMTQGAVSQRIKRLEDVFGAALLERNQHGAGLTAGGRQLLSRARELVALNDEIAATLPAPDGAARPVVRLGVPHDLIGTHLPPLLQEYARRHPHADVTLVPGSSLELRQAYDSGQLDLALIEQPASGAGGERLSLEQPVWVGAHGGTAWTRRPLPVRLVSPTCVFRGPVEQALAGAGIASRPTIDYASMDATSATVQADLAVTAWLASTVPPTLAILGPASGLPALPPFAIALHAAPDAAPAVVAMANCARDLYAARRKS